MHESARKKMHTGKLKKNEPLLEHTGRARGLSASWGNSVLSELYIAVLPSMATGRREMQFHPI